MSFKRMRLHIESEEGSGLILALMTLLVLSVLGASLGAVTVGSFKLGDVNRDDTSAYYIAEAGANQTFENIKTEVLKSYDDSQTKNGFFNMLSPIIAKYNRQKYSDDLSDTFADQFGDKPAVTIEVIHESSQDGIEEYVIQSFGKVGSRERLVTKVFEVSWVTDSDVVFANPEDAAIISNGKISFKKKSIISGNVVINDTNEFEWPGNSMDEAEDVIDGEVITPISNWKDYLDLANSFPDDSKFSTELDSNTIDTIDSDNLYYYTNDLRLGDLKINGGGTVNIYVNDSLEFNGDSFNKMNDFRNVKIYYAGSDQLNIRNHYDFNASLFIESAAISIGNKVSYTGVLLSGSENGEIKLSQHGDYSDTYIIAPHLEVKMNNQTNYNGFVISNAVDIVNQFDLVYKDIGSFPFSADKTESGEEGTSKDIITSEPVIESD